MTAFLMLIAITASYVGLLYVTNWLLGKLPWR